MRTRWGQRRRPCPSEDEDAAIKQLTEDGERRGAFQSVKLLLQPPPEVDLLQQNLLELLCRTRETLGRQDQRPLTFWTLLPTTPFSMFSTSFFRGTGDTAPRL